MRTLLSYCSVHGSQGGGLASVRMELVLLLQELQQDRRMTWGLFLFFGPLTFSTVSIYTFLFSGAKESSSHSTQHQLLSPLPFPTSLPLLAATVAGTKIITTDPVRHLEVSDDFALLFLVVVALIASLCFLESNT